MKVSWSKCPHCGKVLDWKVEGGAGTTKDFGKPIVMKCPKCSGLVSNGLKEWSDLSKLSKIKAIARIIYTVIFYGVATGGIIAAVSMYAFNLEEPELIVAAIVLVAVSLIIYSVLYFRALKREISESIARSSGRIKT